MVGPSVPSPVRNHPAATRVLYALLLTYALITGTYQVVNAVSTATGFFNLRNQVQTPFQLYGNRIVSSTPAAVEAGLDKGDTILQINGAPFTGQAFWQRMRWYAHPGDTVVITVAKPNGTQQTARFPSMATRPAIP
jgi:hypothetical protein